MSYALRRSLCAGVAVCSVGVAAHAQGVPALPDPLPREATSPYPLAPPRRLELHASTSLQLDWNGRADRPQDASLARASFLGGLEVVLPFWNQRFRPGVFFGVQGGHWGDDMRGPFSLVPGFRLRISPFMEDVLDVYGVLRADLPISISTDAGIALRGGIGAGVRVARLVSMELTFDPVFVPISRPFRDTSYTTVLPWAATASLMFDMCIIGGLGCAPSKRKPLVRNVSCVLYEQARTVGEGVCGAVPEALQAAPDPRTASRMDDGTSAFLAALAALVKDEPSASAVVALAARHGELAEQVVKFQRREAAHASVGLVLRERWIYAPVPTELREYFGCTGARPATCVELAEAP